MANIGKQHKWVQTSASTFVDDSDSNGIWRFSAGVDNSATGTISFTPPGGTAQAIPYLASQGAYGLGVFFSTQAALDAAYPDGNYAVTFNGTTTTVAFTGGNYSNVPLATLSQGSWGSSWYTIDPSVPLTITLNFTTNYTAGYAHMSLTVSGNSDSYSNSVSSPNLSTNQLTITIPANTLTRGNTYTVKMDLDNISTLNTTAVSGWTIATYYEQESHFSLAAGAPAPSITVQPQGQTATVGQAVSFTVQSTAIANYPSSQVTYQWYFNGNPISGATQSIYNIPSVALSSAGSYSVKVTDPSGSATSVSANLTVTTNSAPSFTMQPVSVTVTPGGTAAFTVGVGGSPTPTLQWSRNGSLISGANGSLLVVSNAGPSNIGNYTCTATNSSGTVPSATATLSTQATATPGRMINLSVNAKVNPSQGISNLTMGFVTGGSGTSGSQSLLIRAGGPALIPYVGNTVLVDPELKVFDSAQVQIASNAGWGTPSSNVALVNAAQANTGAGLVYANTASLDSAVVLSLAASPGYTVQVDGKNGDAGTTLAEVYDNTPANTYTLATPRLVNLSCRITVPANGSLTDGFIINGSTAKTVLIRAIGPGLTQFGVSGAMSDPVLTVYNGSTVIASNSGWGGDPQLSAALTVAQAQPNPPQAKDCVVLLTLAPGSYTAVATSSSGASGNVLVDIYEIQ